jgi:hypothetical protein
MARAIRDLFGDSAMRRRLELTARRTAERDWGWDRIAERQLGLYETLRSMNREAPLTASSE